MSQRMGMMGTTTTAKLRELLEAASPGPWTWGDVTVKTQNAEIRLASDMDAKLAAAAPALARLVLELSEALEAEAARLLRMQTSLMATSESALAAVEELEL